MIDERLSRPVELGGQPALGDGHPDAGGEALAQRPRGGLDAGRVAVFRMTGGLAAPLPEPLKILQTKVVPRQVQQAVQQHRPVPRRQDESVPVRPRRIRRIVLEDPGPEDIRHGGRPHGHAGMTRLRLLDGIGRQHANGVDAALVQLLSRVRHEQPPCMRSRVPGGTGRPPRSGAYHTGRHAPQQEKLRAVRNPVTDPPYADIIPRAPAGRGRKISRVTDPA
jgi:hypothetical protein